VIRDCLADLETRAVRSDPAVPRNPEHRCVLVALPDPEIHWNRGYPAVRADLGIPAVQ